MLLNQSPLVNGGNAVGNMNANGGSLTATTGGVANARNMQFGSTGGSANVMNAGNKGLYAVQVDQLHQALFKHPFLLWAVVAEDEEEAKLHAEAEKIGIRTLAVVNTDANVLLVTGHVLALALAPVGVDIPNIWATLHPVLGKVFQDSP